MISCELCNSMSLELVPFLMLDISVVFLLALIIDFWNNLESWILLLMTLFADV
jgi:hypothetical protein